MDNTERQHHIEMLALKRMELERLQEEAMLLDRAYQRRQVWVSRAGLPGVMGVEERERRCME